jgi:hypothetical protein
LLLEIGVAERQAGDERVTFEVTVPVPIDAGITLKPGLYVGKRGRSWLGPQYHVEFTAEELNALGGKAAPGAETVDVDITSIVRSGKIEVFG